MPTHKTGAPRFKLTRGLILSLASNTDVYTRGEKYYKEGKILKLLMEPEADGRGTVVRAVVDGVYKDHDVNLTFGPDGSFKRYGCNCDGNAVWRGTCKHVVAVMLAAMDARDLSAEKRRNEQAADVIGRAFEQQFSESEEEDFFPSFLPAEAGHLSAVSLLPLLSVIKNRALLELKIGTERFYVVKNIKAFIQSVATGRTVEYGKGFGFRHTPAAFTEKSRKLIGLLSAFYETVSDIDELSGRSGNFAASINAGDKFFMDGRFADQFFTLYEDSAVSVFDPKLGPEPVMALLTSAQPDAAFSVSLSESGAELRGNTAAFSFFNGRDYTYFLSGAKLHRLPAGQGKWLTSTLSAMQDLEQPAVTFTGGAFTRFMTFVLPRLRQAGMLSGVIGEADIMPAKPLKAKLYFDATGKDISVDLVFAYGEQAFKLTDEPTLFRDTLSEARFLRFFEKWGFARDERSGRLSLSNNDAIFEFYRRGIAALEGRADIFATEGFAKREIKPPLKPSFGVRLSGGLLSFSLANLPYPAAELLDALASYQLKKKYHKLKSGAFIDLSDDGFLDCARTLAALDVSKRDLKKGDKIELPAYRALLVDDLLSESGTAGVFRDEAFTNLIDNIRRFADCDFAVPNGLNGELRGYQVVGYKWLRMLISCGLSGILADEMGLGKTVEIIALLLSQKGQVEDPSLVVTPTSLMYNWAHEIHRFAPTLSVAVVAGPPLKRRGILEEQPPADVYVTTYDLLKRDIAAYEKRSFHVVVADEAQYIKNPATQNAAALKRLKSAARFALTGTPIENALMELWSIFDFILPGYLFGAAKFSKFFEAPIVKDEDDGKKALLVKHVSPFILRRMKSDVLKELPEKMETTLYADMLPEQQKLYHAHLLKARAEAADLSDSGQSKLQILALLTRLRQICCHPGAFLNGYAGGSGKLDLAVDTIVSAVESGHRVLLFSQFTSMLNLLMKPLLEQGISCFYLDGGTEASLRATMAEQFNRGEKDVFLVSLRAGGSGLNLTGADVVIHYDQWWNPAVMNQATDRAHRIGQQKIVQVIHLVTQNTIEEKILELQSRKKELVDAVLSENTADLGKMTAEELKGLFFGL